MEQGRAPLIGRDRELATVQDALRRAAAGEPSVVLVRGEAGVGKTRLVTTVLAELDSDEQIVGHCAPAIAGETPFAPLVDAVRDVLQGEPQRAEALLAQGEGILASVFPELTRTGAEPVPVAGAWERTRLVSALVDLIFRIAELGPTVLLVEDVHWADRETAQVLTVLARRLQDQRFGVVLTWREDEHAPAAGRDWLVEMQRLPAITDVALDRLDRGQVSVLLGELLDAPVSPSTSEWVQGMSDGNPYAVVELARAVRLRTTSVPATLTDLALARLRGITPDARVLVELLAAARRPLSEQTLAAAAGLGEATVPALLELLNRQAVVPAGGEQFALRHAILAEAVTGLTTPSQRRRRHEQLAEALCAAEPAAPAADIAGHWTAAGRWPEALRWTLRAAAEAAAVYGFAASAQHLERAAQLWDRVPEAAAITGTSRWRLLSDAAMYWNLAGQFDESNRIAATFADEIRRDRPPEAANLLARHAEALFEAAHDTAAAVGVAREAAALAEGGRDELSAEAAARVTLLLLGAGMATEAIGVAERASSAATVPAALLAARGSARLVIGDVPGGIDDLERAMGAAADLLTRIRAAVGLTDGLWRLNQLNRAVAVGTPILAELRAATVTGSGAQSLLWNVGTCLIELGRLDEAAELISPDADESLNLSTKLAYLLQARLQWLRGDVDSAARLVASLRAIWGTNSPDVDIQLAAGEVEVALHHDHPEEVAELVEACVSRNAASSEAWQLAELGWLAARAGADVTIAARRAGRDGDARWAAEEIDRIVDALPEPARRPAPGGTGAVVEGFMATLAAERSRAAGDHDPARWRAARDTWHALHRRLYELYASARLAEALAQHGAVAQAQSVLTETGAGAARIGFHALREELAAMARRYRLRVGPTEVGDGPLTARELEVLALIAAGRTNGEIGAELFISTKTASVHVSNIMRKLQVTTRTEAATVALRRGLLPVTDS